MRRDPPASTELRTDPSLLLDLLDRLETFPRHVAERGRRYAQQDRVTIVGSGRHDFRGEVRGTRLYDVLWRYSGTEWLPSCSCPVGPACKHAFALALEALGPLADEVVIQEPLDPEDDVIDFHREVHGNFGAPREVPRAAAARDPGRLDQEVARIRDGAHLWERSAVLYTLLRALPDVPYWSAANARAQEALKEPDPDLRLWYIAQVLSEETRNLPPALAAYLDRPDLEERDRARVNRVLAQRLSEWVERPATAGKSVRVALLPLEERRGALRIGLQVLATAKRLRDEPRSAGQVRGLIDDSRRNPGMFPPEQVALLEFLRDRIPDGPGRDTTFRVSGSTLSHLLMTADRSPLVTWGEAIAPALAERFGIVPGEPVRLGEPVRVEPACGGDDAPLRVRLECFLPDGDRLDADRVGWIRSRAEGAHREPTLVLAEGRLHLAAGDPPSPLADMFAYTGGLVLEGRDGRRLAETLAARFPRFARSMGRHARIHRVRAAVSLDLRDNDWLQIRAFAVTDPQWRPGDAPPARGTIFELEPDGRWGRLALTGRGGAARLAFAEGTGAMRNAADAAPASDAPEPPATGLGAKDAADTADVWLETPDPERTDPVVRWVAATGAGSGLLKQPGGRTVESPDRNVGWWLRLGTRAMDRLAQAWEDRPARVEWFGNEAARRLLSGPARRGPQLKVASSGLDWFSISVEWEDEAQHLSESDLAKLRAARTPFVKLSSGWTRRAEDGAADAAAEALAELGLEPGQEQRVGIWQLAGARPEALAALEGLADSDAARKELAAIREKVAAFRGLPRVEVPQGITADLRPYQRSGLDFLAYASSLGLGVVLADDMGLGKTLQALAWLLWLRAREPKGGPCLVVCPASVVHNWEREAERFAPGLRVLPLVAGTARKQAARAIPRHDLVLTNYALLRRDLEELKAVEWRAVILDEAQNIKNPESQANRAARALTARHRLALTGTPLENRALDLWSLMAFLNPGFLGPRAAFARRYDRADAPPHTRRRLAAKLRPVLLRRLKRQVAPELPPRIEERRDCPMTPGQRKLYLAEVAKGRKVLEELKLGGFERNKISILAVLTRLRQVCCHPALIGGREDLGSGKFDALFELLESLFAEGHKVLVFSQFVECLRRIGAGMDKRGWARHELTGGTPTAKRREVVAAFEQDERPCAFLVSLKAGGTGLNLTAANYVVLFDPWWNPAVEAQAIDRTHRIGQDRTVIAYRMLAAGTLEERIFEMQQRKAALADAVLGEDGFAKGLTREDLDFLLAGEA